MSMKLKKTSNSYLKTHMSSQRFLKLNSMEDFSVSNNTTHRIKPKSQNRKKKSMNRMDEASHRNKIDTETISSHNKHRRLNNHQSEISLLVKHLKLPLTLLYNSPKHSIINGSSMDKMKGDADENAVARAVEIYVGFSERWSKGRRKGER